MTGLLRRNARRFAWALRHPRLWWRRYRVSRAYAKLVRHRDGFDVGFTPIMRMWGLMQADGVISLVAPADDDPRIVWHWPDDWELGDVAQNAALHADVGADRLVVGGRALVLRDERGQTMVVDEVSDADGGSVTFAEPAPEGDGRVLANGRRVILEVTAADEPAGDDRTDEPTGTGGER